MAKSSTGETPLSLVYGVEALIPVEVGEPTLRYFQGSEEANIEAMLVNLELLDECRDLAHVRMAAQKQRMERYYNRRAKLLPEVAEPEPEELEASGSAGRPLLAANSSSRALAISTSKSMIQPSEAFQKES
nr:uncharacterized protein LOC117279104 [Nicotiana tomentosiformis]